MSLNRQIESSVPPHVSIRLQGPLLARAEDHPSGDFIPPHTHDSDQLVHASSGVMTVETQDGFWVVPTQRAVWVPANIVHSIRMTGAVKLRTLYVDHRIAAIPGDGCCVVQVSTLLHAAILRAIDFDSPFESLGREARLVGVILDEIRTAKSAALHLPFPKDARARRVAEHVQQNLSDRRPIAELARAAGTSERTLERLFSREVGMTFGVWRRQARLLGALERLASGESVTSAAFEVGFETPSSFIAMFKRAMGTSPARYFRAPLES